MVCPCDFPGRRRLKGVQARSRFGKVGVDGEPKGVIGLRTHCRSRVRCLIALLLHRLPASGVDLGQLSGAEPSPADVLTAVVRAFASRATGLPSEVLEPLLSENKATINAQANGKATAGLSAPRWQSGALQPNSCSAISRSTARMTFSVGTPEWRSLHRQRPRLRSCRRNRVPRRRNRVGAGGPGCFWR